MPVITRSLFLLVIFSMSLIAETHITGDITGMTFESGGNPYIIEQDILIPEGNKAIIKEGCVFLFKPFTGLTVHGHIIVEGTQENPVVFSSFNDGEYNTTSEQLPNPFDWNGILISRESGTVTFKHFSLRFSVYGIKSQNSNIQIDNGIFRQNGQFHFTINDKIQFVQDNIAYSYNGEQDALKAKPAVTDSSGNPVTYKKKKNKKGVIIFRYTSLGFGIAGAGAAIAFGTKWSSTYDEIVQISNKYDRKEVTPLDVQRDKELREETLPTVSAITIASGIVGGIGLLGFGISFFF